MRFLNEFGEFIIFLILVLFFSFIAYFAEYKLDVKNKNIIKPNVVYVYVENN